MFDLIKEAKGLLNKNPKNTEELWEVRIFLTSKLCWFLPVESNINTILHAIKDSNHILEIGCGTGIVGKYIVGKYPDKSYLGIRKSMYDCDYNTYYPRQVKNIRDNDLYIYLNNPKFDTWLLIWPPYMRPLAKEVFKSFLKNNHVKNLLYIGELEGANGDNEFYNILDDWIYSTPSNLKLNHYDFKSYPGIHDICIKFSKQI